MAGGKVIDRYGDVKIVIKEGERLPTYVCPLPDERSVLGPLKPLLSDDQLEEVMFNGEGQPVHVFHRKHGMCRSQIRISNAQAETIIAHIAKFVQKEVSPSQPLLDGRLPDGSRVNATLPPATPDGPTLTVRKFLKDSLTIVDLISYRTLTPHAAAFLWVCVDGLGVQPANILISGGTGSGKTTTLNSLASFISERERVISIEDTAELQLKHDHWIRMEVVPPKPGMSGEVTMDMLLKNTLRMRPDRIIVGEVRGSEALTLFTAMNTGHDGCMGTLHANTAMETVTRLINAPMSVPPVLVTGLDLIVMMQRVTIGNKTHRRVTEISEVGGLEGDKPRLNTLFKWQPKANMIAETGVPSKIREQICRAANINLAKFDMVVQERQRLLEEMVAKGKRSTRSVATIVQNYYAKSHIV